MSVPMTPKDITCNLDMTGTLMPLSRKIPFM